MAEVVVATEETTQAIFIPMAKELATLVFQRIAEFAEPFQESRSAEQ